MGWSTLGDLCINDGKLLGCSFYRNSVGIWVADVSVFPLTFHCLIALLFHPPGCSVKIYHMSPFSPSLLHVPSWVSAC